MFIKKGEYFFKISKIFFIGRIIFNGVGVVVGIWEGDIGGGQIVSGDIQ